MIERLSATDRDKYDPDFGGAMLCIFHFSPSFSWTCCDGTYRRQVNFSLSC